MQDKTLNSTALKLSSWGWFYAIVTLYPFSFIRINLETFMKNISILIQHSLTGHEMPSYIYDRLYLSVSVFHNFNRNVLRSCTAYDIVLAICQLYNYFRNLRIPTA